MLSPSEPFLLGQTRTSASWPVNLCTVLLVSFHVLNVGQRMALDTDPHLLSMNLKSPLAF